MTSLDVVVYVGYNHVNLVNASIMTRMCL